MRNLSIFSKIFVGYIISALLFLVFVISFTVMSIRSHYIEKVLVRDLYKTSKAIMLSLDKGLIENHVPSSNSEWSDLNVKLNGLSAQLDIPISLVRANGSKLADSQNDMERLSDSVVRDELHQALQKGYGSKLRDKGKDEVLNFAAKVPEMKGVFLFVRYPAKDIKSPLSELFGEIIVVAVLAIAVSIVMAAALSRHVSTPLARLSEGVKQVAGGNFDARIFVRSSDETKDLADSFNHMTQQLKTLFEEVSQQKEELKTIIESLGDSLIVIGIDGKVVLCNKRFTDIFLRDPNLIVYKYYWDIVREPELYDLINEAKEEKKSFTKEIQIKEKEFRCRVTYSTKGVIIVLHDITEVKNLERAKKMFVDNVSHELRTPLTSIKGFLETMEGGVKSSSKSHLEIIMKNTDRLIRIVEDLLALSSLENEKFKLMCDEVNVNDIINSAAKIFSKRIKDKDLKLQLNLEKKLGSIKADAFKLEQVFVNLIDNAVKYTEEGKISISSAKGKDNEVIINVQDTGVGINSDSLEKIFERFYVVDKSRSRVLGGTGLGLSIVKHIVMLHGGGIKAYSEPGSGTRFEIILPQDGAESEG